MIKVRPELQAWNVLVDLWEQEEQHPGIFDKERKERRKGAAWKNSNICKSIERHKK